MNPANWWWIPLLYIPAALVTRFLYKPRQNPLLFALRSLALFFLFLFFLNPGRWKIREKTLKPPLYVLVDNSLSIVPYASLTDSMAEKLARDRRLRENFDIRVFRFDDSIYELPPARPGKQTDIYAALAAVASQAPASGPFPVILLTDGNTTRGRDYAAAAQDFPSMKIFPVAVGDTVPRPDVKIERLDYNPSVARGNSFPLQLWISAANISRPVTTEIRIKQQNTTLFRRKMHLSPRRNAVSLRVVLKARTPGLHRYRIEATPLEGEKDTLNNRKTIWINVTDRQARILLLTGKIHPDAGALRRILSEASRYRIETARTVPSGQHYDLIILIQPGETQIESALKTHVPLWWITGIHTDWNALNKKGLWFSRQIAGNLTEEYFARPNPEFDLFELPPPPPGLPPLRDLFGELRLAGPVRIIYFSTVKNRPLRQALMAVNTQNKQVLLAGQGIWRWYMHEKKAGDPSHISELIHKTAAYLISSPSENQLVVQYETLYGPNEPVRMGILLFNPLMEPDIEAVPEFRLKTPEGKIRKIPVFFREGQYMADLGRLDPGFYTFTVRSRKYGIVKRGGFEVASAVSEASKNAEIESLERLARDSGGELFYPSRIDSLRKALLRPGRFPLALHTERHFERFTDRRLWLLLFVLLLTVEWICRKYSGRF